MKNYVIQSMQTIGAAEYSCGTYGSSAYNSGNCVATTTTEGLSQTGVNFYGYLGGGILLIAIAIVLTVQMMRRKKASQN